MSELSTLHDVGSVYRDAQYEPNQRGGRMSMEIRRIKNDHDHREALKEIERLMDAGPNVPEGDRLDLLVKLVEIWEEKHWPIDAPDPSSIYYR